MRYRQGGATHSDDSAAIRCQWHPQQVSEPRRPATESNPSLNSEGSTRSAVGQALSLPNPQASQAQGLTYPSAKFSIRA